MAPDAESSAVPQLGWDVLFCIVSVLPHETLLALRLANRSLSELASRRVFRHVRLSADEDGKRFVRIARSEKLRPYVCEVTVDTNISHFDYHSQGDYTMPWQFYYSLPFVRYFGNLRVLNLRFNRFCEAGYIDKTHPFGYESEEECPDIRFRILDTVFRGLAGTWTAKQQFALDMKLDLKDNRDILSSDKDDKDDDKDDETRKEKRAFFADNYKGHSAPPHKPPRPGLTLTVGNLGDYDDPRLTGSEAFRSVLGTQITHLKLLLAVRVSDADPQSALHFADKYELAEKMPRTWLMPALARNLRTLSLYSQDYWGWAPRMDFRWINPGAGPDSGFPHLRVLALGNYIFSHEWQIDWVASLGKQNGAGGLEELYLDDTPILYGADVPAPLDAGTTETTNTLTEDKVAVSNDNYPLTATMTRSEADTATITIPLRWSHILGRWGDTMGSLRVFRMGRGGWGTYRDSVHLNYNQPTYDFDSPVFCDDGEEFCVCRHVQCQYIYFHCCVWPGPWCESFLGERIPEAKGPDPAITHQMEDTEALEKFQAVVDQHRQSGAA